MKKLTGKYLVRKAKLNNGTPVLILSGVFYPNFDISEVNDNDEMWVSEIIVSEGGIKFTEPVNNIDAISPEDFLENIHNQQSPKFWKNKLPLE